jgi:hypothetical protein
LFDLYIVFGAIYLTYVRSNSRRLERTLAKHSASPQHVREYYKIIYSKKFYIGTLFLAADFILKLSVHPVYRVDHTTARVLYELAKLLGFFGLVIIIMSIRSAASSTAEEHSRNNWKPPV